MVRNDSARTLPFDLDQAIQEMTGAVGADAPNLLKLTGVCHKLLRLWGASDSSVSSHSLNKFSHNAFKRVGA